MDDAEFEYDVFVSYSSADDWTEGGERYGWVHKLVEFLGHYVGKLLTVNRDPAVYIDDRLETGSKISGALLEAIGRSRFLLVVLTPRYLASEWCLSELDCFLERGDVDKTLFIVEAEEVESWQKPESLRERHVIRFWRKQPMASFSQRLDPRRGQEHDTLFRDRVDELAHAIHSRMQAPEIQSPSKGDVWIAEATGDVDDQRNKLAAALRQAGWCVVPEPHYLSHDQDLYLERLRRHLESAKLFVQLLGPDKGHVPDWEDSPLTVVQANEARRFSQQRKVPWLRWRSEGSAVAVEAGTAYSDLLNEGEVQEIGFREFSKAVLDALNAPVRTVPRQEAPGVLMIDIRCDSDDKALAENVEQSLAEFDNVDSITSFGVKSIEELNSLDACDGVIVIYGTTPVPWVQAQFSLMRKAFGKVRQKGTIAILKAPPPPKEANLGIYSRVLQTLDGTAGIEPAVLKGFIERVRAESAQNRDHV